MVVGIDGVDGVVLFVGGVFLWFGFVDAKVDVDVVVQVGGKMLWFGLNDCLLDFGGCVYLCFLMLIFGIECIEVFVFDLGGVFGYGFSVVQM